MDKPNQSPTKTIANILLISLSILCAVGWLKSSYALAAGLLWAWFFAGSHALPLSSWGSFLLKTAIVLLGLSLPMTELLDTAKDSFLLTIGVIGGALIIGLLLAKILKLDKEQGWLISSGTAICGGSAIAAVGSSIKANGHNMVISLAIVFILNAVALFTYPAIGHWLELTQQQFGLWAALGIHDTSSVVGAAGEYGDQALDIATTTKLSRALWIIPVALIASMANQSGKFRLSIPLFIIMFLFASSLGSVIGLEVASTYIKPAAKSLFALSLLWMGSSLNQAAIRSIPIKSMLLGVILWLLVSIVSLWLVMTFY